MNYIETVGIVRSFMISNKILPSIKNRINEFLLHQWMYDNGYNIMKNRYILYDAPYCLLHSIKSALYSPLLKSVPLFQVKFNQVLLLKS